MFCCRKIAQTVVVGILLVPFVQAGVPPQRLAQGLAAAKKGSCEAAVRQLQVVVRSDTSNPAAYNALGVCETQLGRPERATAYFQRVVDLAPKVWQGWNNLGGNYMTLNRLPEAVEAFRKAIKLDPNVPAVRFNEASALLKLRKNEEAFRSLNEARRLAPDDPQIHKTWLTTAGLLATQAARLLDQGKFRKAEALLLETQDALKSSASWNDLLGYAEFKDEKPKLALRHLQEALRIDPDNVDYLMDIGEFLTHYSAYHEATEMFKIAEERMPDSPRVQFGLAVSYILENRRNKASDILQQLIARDPKFEPAYHALGECYEDAGDGEAMVALGKKLQLMNDQNPTGWYLVGAGLFRQSLQDYTMLPHAISALEHAASLSPKSAHTHFTLARAYEKAGDYTKAIAELKETLRLNPEHERAHYVLARIYQRLGKSKLAKAQFAAHNKVISRNNHNDYRMLLTRSGLR